MKAASRMARLTAKERARRRQGEGPGGFGVGSEDCMGQKHSGLTQSFVPSSLISRFQVGCASQLRSVLRSDMYTNRFFLYTSLLTCMEIRLFYTHSRQDIFQGTPFRACSGRRVLIYERPEKNWRAASEESPFSAEREPIA